MWREWSKKTLVAPSVSDRRIHKYLIFTVDGPTVELSAWFPGLTDTSKALMTVEQGLSV